MSERPASIDRWRPVLDRMMEDLGSGAARSQAYWAQQLAFGPVLIHAVALGVRDGVFSRSDLDLLRGILPSAIDMLGALPDGCEGDPTRLHLLARRQATVLASGRRRQLSRLADRLGLETSSLPAGPVPRRFQRLYPLIGWNPPESP